MISEQKHRAGSGARGPEEKSMQTEHGVIGLLDSFFDFTDIFNE